MDRRFFYCIALLLITSVIYAKASIQTIQGEAIALSSLKGRLIFINYWASWCQPCIDEIAALNRFYQQRDVNHVAVFAVNYDGISEAKQEALIKKFGIEYPSLKEASVKALKLGDISVVPITFVIASNGKVREVLYGEQKFANLQKAARLK